jgi:hypothetical protein
VSAQRIAGLTASIPSPSIPSVPFPPRGGKGKLPPNGMPCPVSVGGSADTSLCRTDSCEISETVPLEPAAGGAGEPEEPERESYRSMLVDW